MHDESAPTVCEPTADVDGCAEAPAEPVTRTVPNDDALALAHAKADVVPKLGVALCDTVRGAVALADSVAVLDRRVAVAVADADGDALTLRLTLALDDVDDDESGDADADAETDADCVTVVVSGDVWYTRMTKCCAHEPA